MSCKLVEIDTIQNPIKRCPGFEKKALATYKLDILGLCQFQCTYCSSNSGNYLRIHREKFKANTMDQLGIDSTPVDDSELMFIWPDILINLELQLAKKKTGWGAGQTLVFSMLTDGFSPYLVKQGITEQALRLVLERTQFRIRVLTKNAVVGSEKWIAFFKRWPGRFVVGLSCGTMDDTWAKQIERGASLPSARLRALKSLQDAGVPTYGMLCPIFPDVLENNKLNALIDAINPDSVESIWAEPYNDRQNWQKVRQGYSPLSYGYHLLTEIHKTGDRAKWSSYATDLYLRLIHHATRNNWSEKLKYLLYEKDINNDDAKRLFPFSGILFQGKKGGNGLSKNDEIRKLEPLIINK